MLAVSITNYIQTIPVDTTTNNVCNSVNISIWLQYCKVIHRAHCTLAGASPSGGFFMILVWPIAHVAPHIRSSHCRLPFSHFTTARGRFRRSLAPLPFLTSSPCNFCFFPAPYTLTGNNNRTCILSLGDSQTRRLASDALLAFSSTLTLLGNLGNCWSYHDGCHMLKSYTEMRILCTPFLVFIITLTVILVLYFVDSFRKICAINYCSQVE